MYSLLLRPEADQREEITAALSELGTAGLIEEGLDIRAFFDDCVNPAALIKSYGSTLVETRHEDGTMPAKCAVEDWEPIMAGDRFVIAPPWVDQPASAGRVRLTIDAADAFGTGRHESTQLAIEALEKYLRNGDTVLDVGCGSGVLALAAKALGAGRIIGCDVHPGALPVARKNAGAPVFLGSADAIATDAADITIANISARVVDALATELQRVTKPRRLIVLAGFIAERPPRRFEPEEILERDDWQCWICRPERVLPADSEPRPLQPFSEQWW